MARESIRIVGGAKAAAAIRRAGTKAHEAAIKAVKEETELIRQDAVRIAPRRTGDLESKIDGEAHELEGTIKSKSRHAGFVEHGTYKDKAQPYMAPAADHARGRFPKRATAIIKAALGG